MQVVGMGQGALGYKYNNALEALREILKHEGFIGLYRGLWPNLCGFFFSRYAWSFI